MCSSDLPIARAIAQAEIGVKGDTVEIRRRELEATAQIGQLTHLEGADGNCLIRNGTRWVWASQRTGKQKRKKIRLGICQTNLLRQLAHLVRTPLSRPLLVGVHLEPLPPLA